MMVDRNPWHLPHAAIVNTHGKYSTEREGGNFSFLQVGENVKLSLREGRNHHYSLRIGFVCFKQN